MKRRLLSIFLVLVMVLAMAAGCGAKESAESAKEDESSKEEVAEESKQEEKQEESKAEEAEEAPAETEELTTIHILASNDWTETIHVEDWESSPVSQSIIEDLAERGIRLEVETVDGASYDDVVKTRMASSSDIPDLLLCWDTATVMDWVNNGLVYNVSELLEQYDEDGSIQAFYEEYAPGVFNRGKMPDGNLYYFQYLSNAAKTIDAETGTEYTFADSFNLSLRRDWVEAIGEEWKDFYTTDELFDLLTKMQEQDANGNGKKDEIISVNIDDFWNGIAQGFGLNGKLLAGYFKKDNKVFSNFYHENFPAYIEYMKKLYDSGLYDTVRLSSSDDELISEDRVSATYHYGAWMFEDSLPQNDGESMYYWPTILDDNADPSDNCVVLTDNTDAVGYGMYLIPKASQNAEAVVKLMDYVYTETYAVKCWYGLEGTGYEVNEQGQYVQINADENFFMTGAGYQALPCVNVIPGVKNRYVDGAPENSNRKLDYTFWFSTEVYPVLDSLEFNVPTWANPTEEQSEFISEKEALLETYCQELLVDLILGNKSLDDLPEYLEELDSLGMQEYLQIMQDRCDRANG